MTYTQNRTAKFNYEIIDTYEAGISLLGAEVKSIRANKISLKESYIKIKDGELWLTNAHIAIPSYATHFSRFEEKRDRKLLMHKKEILKLGKAIEEKGLTLICLSVYQSENAKKLKIKLALARGKKTYDKKQTIKERDLKRDMDRALRKY